MQGLVKRRRLMGLMTGLMLAVPRQPGRAEYRGAPTPGERSEWESFKARFVRSSGRVVDTGNQDASHSEGQGWALLLSEAYDDEASFDRILAWTQRELKRPYDSLHAWSWRPGRARPVEDGNNATDGDIFIAWALARASRRWRRPELAGLATQMVRDLHRLCVRDLNGRAILLPAAFGFEHATHLVVNLSYYVFPAFPTLARLMPGGSWRAVAEDGRMLLRQARFGRWSLPADWVQIDGSHGRPQPAQGWAPRFSYDAVRIPLYLSWAGMRDEPAVQAAAQFWSGSGPDFMPAWTDVAQNTSSPYPADSGIVAVATLVNNPSVQADALPQIQEASSYYAAGLTLLARLAAFERSLG